jgi:PAS domain-containing protein
MTWTQELYRLHGFSPDQFEPGSPEHIKNSLACYESEDREVLGKAFEACATLGVPYDLELTFTPLGGEQMRVRTSAEAVWVNGRVSKVLGTFQDVTEKRILEQRYETLFQHMLDGFSLHEIICDAGGRPVDYRFLEVNPAFERHTGLEAGTSRAGRCAKSCP